MRGWPKRNKFNAKRTNGFHSKLEAAVHGVLLMREKLGEIKDIKCQQSITLQEGDSKTRIRWRVDFSAIDCKTNQLFFIEAKGLPDAVFLLKLRLYKKVRKEKLEIYKGNFRNPILAEVING